MELFDIKSDAQEAIEKFIIGNESFVVKMRVGLSAIARVYAESIWNNARKQSYGPRDPSGTQDPNAAFTIPVRRITGDYFEGWKIKGIAPGVYWIYNASREAWRIEYGLNPYSTHTPVRRPVLKTSVTRAIEELSALPGILAGESWVSEGGASFVVSEAPGMGAGAMYSAGSVASTLESEV